MEEMRNIGRPLEFDPVSALDAAIDVFWREGYKGANMTGLLEAMNLSKSSLYQSFGNKSDLFQRCLTKYADDLASSMQSQLVDSNSGWEFIVEFLYGVADTAQRPEGVKGCFLVNSVNEFGQTEEKFLDVFKTGIDAVNSIFFAAVERAKKEGEIKKNVDLNDVVIYLQIVISGMRTMIKGGLDKKTTKTMVSLMLENFAQFRVQKIA